MQHTEFADAYKRGTIDVDVDHKGALQIAGAADGLPRSFRYTHIFWTSAWISTLPAAIAAGIIYSWWAAVLVLLVLTPALFAAAKISAARQIVRYAVANSLFYEYVVDYDVIRIRQKPAQNLNPPSPPTP